MEKKKGLDFFVHSYVTPCDLLAEKEIICTATITIAAVAAAKPNKQRAYFCGFHQPTFRTWFGLI